MQHWALSGRGRRSRHCSGRSRQSALGRQKKIAGLVGLTSEIAEHSIANAEAVMRVLLEEAASRGLDAAVFSATPASATQPAGILNNIVALTPTAGGGAAAMVGDLQNLVGAVVDAGGAIRSCSSAIHGKR
jgi:HK97 family phage major capsid protein